MKKEKIICGLFVLMAMSPATLWAGEGSKNSSTEVCKQVLGKEDSLVELKDKPFPIKDLVEIGEVQQLDGPVKAQAQVTEEGKVVYSSMELQLMAYFFGSVMPDFANLNAQDFAAFSRSTPIMFLRNFGTEEMKLLGPDLKADNPFLDTTIEAKAPSEREVEQTQRTIRDLAKRMTGLIGEQQESILTKLGRLDFKGAKQQLDQKLREVAASYSFTADLFKDFVSDKNFLLDIQNLLAENLMKFEKDLDFIGLIQERYLKTARALEGLANMGEQILAQEEMILNSIKDADTKEKVRKAFLRFHVRVTDLRSGVARAETYHQVWEIIKDNHFELIMGIERALYYNVGIIGAHQMMNNALNQQENTRIALRELDETSNDLLRQMNEKMKTSTQVAQRKQLEQIAEDSQALTEMVIAMVAVDKMNQEHAPRLKAALATAREDAKKIAAQARAIREGKGVNPAEAELEAETGVPVDGQE